MLKEKAIEGWKWCSNSQFRFHRRELLRLRCLPRYQKTSSAIAGIPIELVDSESFLGMYKEIFERQIYYFEAHTSTPYIIDGGANIGLGVIYFKNLYPQSEIVAFEPDPHIFTVLERNVSGFSGITLQQKALWTQETLLPFRAEGSWGGRLSSPGPDNITVSATRLSNYLCRPVDLLKLDIEGAETEVLRDCEPYLGSVARIFVEYHSFAAQPQTIHIVTKILADAGFRMQIHPQASLHRPFAKTNTTREMDLQLNIFGFREDRSAESKPAQ